MSVVQVTVAEVVEIALTVTAEMIGAPAAVVLNVKFADVVCVPTAFADCTEKLNAVPGVNPVSVTECAVASVLLSADEDP